MKSWQKLLLAVSLLSVIATATILIIDYRRDCKVISAVKKLLEKKKVIEL